jgi:hypothetical protein
MLPKAGTVEPVEAIIARQRYIKHVPAATDIVATVENTWCLLLNHCWATAG